MQGKEQIDSLPFKGRARVGMGCEVQPLLASPKGRGQKWIKKRNLSERSELFRFPFLSSPFWAPEGRRLGVAFLCFLSLAKQRKEVARRGQSRLARSKK